MIIIEKILVNDSLVPARALSKEERGLIIGTISNGSSYVHYVKGEEEQYQTEINIITQPKPISLSSHTRTVLIKTDVFYGETEYKIGFRSGGYYINELDYVIEIYYEKFLYDVNDMLIDYLIDEDEKILYVRRGRLMPEFDVNGVATGGQIDEYEQWIQILTNQKLIDPIPFIQYGILEEEGFVI
jgi:hypothetical protein